MADKTADKRGIKKYIPILEWLPKYQASWFRTDLIAGLVVLSLLIPEGMAYAQMAGLPPEVAFYTAPAAMIGYAIFTTSRQVISTTTSTVAVMIAAVLGGLAISGMEEYMAYAAGLAVLVGLMFFVMGFLRLGFISEFFSRPVVTGFVFGLAMMIAIRQVPKLLGIEAGGDSFFDRTIEIILHLNEAQFWTIFVGVTSLILLFGLEHFAPRVPAPLVAIVYGILIVTFLDLDARGVHIVGDIPSGIARPKLPETIGDSYGALAVGAVGIVILGYAETIGAARRFAAKHRYDIDPNQELIALGASNLGAGLFQGFAVDASLSKSAANDRSSARSQMSAILAAGMTVLVALFLTPLFHNLPEATLAAIVIVAVWGLFDVKELRRYARLERSDLALALIALFGVLILDVLPGLILAVFLSLLLLTFRASRPHFSILGKFPKEQAYGDIERHPEVKQVPGMVIIRPDTFLFYANATAFREEIRRDIATQEPPPRVVLLELEASKQLDITSVDVMAEMVEDLRNVGCEIWLSRVNYEAWDLLVRSGVVELIGEEHVFKTVHDAVTAYHREYPMVSFDG